MPALRQQWGSEQDCVRAVGWCCWIDASGVRVVVALDTGRMPLAPYYPVNTPGLQLHVRPR